MKKYRTRRPEARATRGAGVLACLLILFSATCSAADRVVDHTRRHNLVRFTLDNGVADIEWVSSGTFRFSRHWDPLAPAPAPVSLDTVDFKVIDSTVEVTLETKHLRVRVARVPLRLSIEAHDGKPLLIESAPVRQSGSSAILERRLPPGEFFFGLGARSTTPVSLRDVHLKSDHPLLLSTLGYGQYFPAQGLYEFDLGESSSEACRILGPARAKFEYFFYYGPGIKDIFEEHLANTKTLDRRLDSDFHVLAEKPIDADQLPAGDLRQTIRALINSSLSAIRLPALDLSSSAASDAHVLALATAMPVVLRSLTPRNAALLPIRDPLIPYLQTYLQEGRDRGFPIIRALPMQFPKDPKVWDIEDQFMLGDELLIAPPTGDGRSRSVYLPMGMWTRLHNNTQHKGRQSIDVEIAQGELPLFAKNGSIVPLASEQAMSLHYFPRLAGEFFLYETDLADISQFHAGPAGDFMRLEIESKHDSVYEWIIHHVTAPRSVVEGSKSYTQSRNAAAMKSGGWRFDERAGNLHIRIEAAAGEDRIVNIRF